METLCVSFVCGLVCVADKAVRLQQYDGICTSAAESKMVIKDIDVLTTHDVSFVYEG